MAEGLYRGYRGLDGAKALCCLGGEAGRHLISRLSSTLYSADGEEIAGGSIDRRDDNPVNIQQHIILDSWKFSAFLSA